MALIDRLTNFSIVRDLIGIFEAVIDLDDDDLCKTSTHAGHSQKNSSQNT